MINLIVIPQNQKLAGLSQNLNVATKTSHSVATMTWYVNLNLVLFHSEVLLNLLIVIGMYINS